MHNKISFLLGGGVRQVKVQVAEVWMNDFLLYISIVVRLIPVSFVFEHVLHYLHVDY